MRLIDAIYEILKGETVPLHPKEIESAIVKRHLFETSGKTLYATIGAALYMEIKKCGTESRFVKCGRGMFAIAGSSAARAKVVAPQKAVHEGRGLQVRRGAKRQGPGYVYILTNPSFRRDWVKIGKTCRKVNVRSAELDNTAVPLPFEIFATMRTVDYEKAERLIHKMIDRFTKKRIRKNREFFNIEPEKALEIFEDVRTVFDDAVIERFDGNAMTIRTTAGKSVGPHECVFVCRGSGADAKAKISDDGFVVLRGSKISSKVVPSMKTYARSMYDLRRKLEQSGIIVGGVFKRQYVFSSSSAAASLVQGRNSNGNTDWRTEDGEKFGTFSHPKRTD